MKVSHSIAINLVDFFKTGQFDYVELGHTRQWLIDHFPEPEIFSGGSISKATIWKYGDLEFHFKNDKLWMIFSDCLDHFSMGQGFELELWLLKDYSKLTLLYVIAELNQQQINFTLTHQANNIKLLLCSGIELDFLSQANQHDINSAHLISFCFAG